MKKIVLSVLVFLFAAGYLSAQKTPAPKATKYATKFKPPALSTIWGGFKDSVGIPAQNAIDLLSKPLYIADGKSGKYTLTSYQLLYKQRAVVEDEQGKVSPTTSVYNSRFSTYPLPQLWVENLSDKINKGDELMLFDIIVKDSQGRPMYAPNIKITVL